jgi:hypothetical protein
VKYNNVVQYVVQLRDFVDTVMNITFLKASNLLTSSVDTTLKIPLFWDVTARRWAMDSRRFEGT